MIGRRVLIGGLALLLGAADATEADRAADFIRRSGKELAAIVSDPAPPPDRRRKLQAFLDRVVDIEGLARFCLGRFWNRATEAQRAAYVAVYHGVLLNAVLARVGDYDGHAQAIHTDVGRPELRDGVMLVPTTVERTGQPNVEMTWALRMDGPAPRIIDLIVEGTSLRVTVRSDYASFLTSHSDSIDALLTALHQQAAPPGAGK